MTESEHLVLLRKFQKMLQELDETRKLIEKQHSHVVCGDLDSIPDMGVKREANMHEQVSAQIQKLENIALQQSSNMANSSTIAEHKTNDPRDNYKNIKEQLWKEFVGTEYSVCSWDSLDIWNNYQPLTETPQIPVIRIGTIEVPGPKEKVIVPLCLEIIGQNNVLVKASGHAFDVVVKSLQNIMLRLLVAFPPARLRFLMIDPVGVGSNFAGFMHLPEEAVSGKIWSDSQKIEQKLGELCEYMENIIQKYLLNHYRTMEEYNEDAAEVAQPYQVVVVANFPTNFSMHAAQRLLSLAKNGPKSGIYVLIHIDPQLKIPYDFSVSELEAACHVFEQKQTADNSKVVFFQKTVQQKFPVLLEEAPSSKRFNEIINKIKDAYHSASRITVPYQKFVQQLYPKWWQQDARESVQIPIGKAGNEEIYFCVGKGLAHHALMVGKTGSGKSTLLNILILGTAIAYSPQEVQLYLIDFKEGVEFKKYADPILPHAKVIAIQSEREFGLSVLKGLDEELTHRGDELFRPNKVKNLTEYRSKKAQNLPRILLIVDEFQEFFTEEDQLAVQARNILERLVRKGRSAGIHIILSSQSLTGSGSLPLSITNQIAIRIALQCSDGDSRLILGDENPAAKNLTRPGEGIYNDANGLIEGNTIFQTFWLEDHIMEEYLHDIHNRAPHKCETILFEGDASGSIENNYALQKLITKNSAQQNQMKIWFGQPIAMKDEHTHVLLHQRTGANILFMGQDEERIMGVFLCAMISAIVQSCRSKSKFYVINLGTVDSIWQSSLDAITSANLPFAKIVNNRRELLEIIEEIHNIVSERQQQETIEQNNERIVLFFIGLHRARDLYAPDSWSPPAETKKFMTILEEGPDVGIHSFVHCDTKANMNKSLSQSLKEFDIRVVLQMNANDSISILDTTLASKLDANRALLYNEEHSSYLEKFCPYEFPNKKWIQTLFDKTSKQ